MVNFLAVLVLVLAIISNTQQTNDPFVDKLISKMSLEEKCGQMTQITLDTITNCPPECSSSTSDGSPAACSCPPSDDTLFPINITKLTEAIETYKVGSILNTAYDRAQNAKIWQQIIKTIQESALKMPNKIPVLYGLDSIHGANYIQEATLFPQPLGMASSFNVDISRKVGEITAMETRAVGVPWNFNPVLDIGRQHLWPRLYETYGEDVYLASHMGSAYIEGSQGDNLKNRTKVATCLKHYIGYSYPLNGRDRSASWIPEIILREYFLPTFEAGVKAGVLTAMINSGDVNGIPGHANSYYINDILKGELAFDGFTVSDWEDIIRLYTRDRMAASPEEAVKIAVMAGLDMSMVPFGYSFHDHCVSLANKDKAFLARVDDAVKRILVVKNKIGLFDEDGSLPVDSDLIKIATSASKDFNLEAARESVILVKNENLLPMNKNKKILVTGTTAGNLRVLNGGWSYKWQGDNEDYFKKYAKGSLMIFDALKQKLNGGSAVYVEGANFTDTININDAVIQADKVDVIVLCIGEGTYTEVFGNIDNLFLDKAQQELADAMIKTGKDIVVVYLGGRPRIITNIVESSNVKGVLISFLPGNRGAEAIADVLFGDYNPDGRLPLTYPRNPNGQTPYDIRPLELFYPNKYEYLYPFGHGLSYTTFQYSDLSLNTQNVDYQNGVTASLKVKNNGTRDGKETVILYLIDEVASISRPIRQVKGFQKVFLKSGSETTVTFKLSSYDFTFINQHGKRVAEDGLFTIEVGMLKAEFTLKNAYSTTPATTPETTPATTPATTRETTTSSANIYSLNSILSLFLSIFVIKIYY